MFQLPDNAREVLVISHANCADGFTAAWVAHRHLRETGIPYEVIFAKYGEGPPQNLAGKFVLIFDFSYPRESLLRMQEEAAGLLVFDHHKTARANCEGLPFCTFDMNRSGCGLAWDYFNPDTPRPYIVDYVEDRDLWRWEMPDSEAVNALIWVTERELGVWEELSTNMMNNGLEDLIERGKLLLRYRNKIVDQAVENARDVEFPLRGNGRAGTAVVPTCCASIHMSEVGNRLAEDRPFPVVWFQTREGDYLYSLRSNDRGMDVSEVAKGYGGGGHRHAAGFRLPQPLNLPGVGA